MDVYLDVETGTWGTGRIVIWNPTADELLILEEGSDEDRRMLGQKLLDEGF